MLRRALLAARSLSWSPTLLRLLLEELYTDDSVEQLLGKGLEALPKRRYADAVAAALIIRHSWQPNDLACIVARLSLEPARGAPLKRRSPTRPSRNLRPQRRS